jgi:hypothetical protein
VVHRSTASTAADGSYELKNLPPGEFKIFPEIPNGLDFDREHDDLYNVKLTSGQCVNVAFGFRPTTRVRGRVIFPTHAEHRTIEVVAVPAHLTKLNQFSGKWDFTDEDGRFDLRPLPPGDYYVGVNINSSPKADSPFPPTYYPGVTEQKKATVIHLETGQIKEVDLPLRQTATPRVVSFTAIGLDGKPMRKVYVQLEDLRHPGDAASYVNVDLDEHGTGTLDVFAGYSYHLHASHWVGYGVYWCAKPVPIRAGSAPVSIQFVMDRQSASCDLSEIDRLRNTMSRLLPKSTLTQ